MFIILSNKEWLRINDIILLIHSSENSKDMRNYFFDAIKSLILFEKAMFYWLKEENSKVKIVDPICVNVNSNFFEEYKSVFENFRYGRVAVNTRRTIAYRDSDLMHESILIKTDVYKSFLLPNNLPHSGGIILTDDSTLLAELVFYRTHDQGDFSDKEIYILDILKKHFKIRLIREKYSKNHMLSEDKTIKLIELGLTNREIEIVKLIINNLSTSEICSKLNISIHTTKKHINHIFSKLEINSRLQLVQLYSNL